MSGQTKHGKKHTSSSRKRARIDRNEPLSIASPDLDGQRNETRSIPDRHRQQDSSQHFAKRDEAKGQPSARAAKDDRAQPAIVSRRFGSAHHQAVEHDAGPIDSDSDDDQEDDDDAASSGRDDAAVKPEMDGSGSNGVEGAANDDQGAATADVQQKKVSCLVCRDAKVKCVPNVDGEPCVRCAKLGKECVFRTHKRGRKPGKIKSQQIQRRLEILDRTLAEINELNQDVRDPDAESLVKTLTWQLHRSKFFSKGYRQRWTRASLSPARSPSGPEPPRDADGERDLTSATGLAKGGRSGSPSHDALETISPAMGRSSSLGRAKPPMNAGNIRSKSDYNMLVDMEDHATVSRVPDEIHTLSNPLKLLAQASDESRHRDRNGGDRADMSISERGDERTRLIDGIAERIEESAEQTAEEIRRMRSRKALRAAAKERKAQGWANTYFSRGAFHPVYDNRPEFDPIDSGIVSADQAERLINVFYERSGTFMHIFDPHLSTITYVRKHSAFLLTVLCATSAEFDCEDGEQGSTPELAIALRRHAEEMMPAVMCGDYKSVEMAQGFLVLAAYQPMSDSAMADQTWAYLGQAIRMATELGCNLGCHSLSTPDVHKQEHYQRQLRNTERLWLNLYIFEKTLASQTGQRFHLSEDGVIAMCSSWHRQEYALPQDEALVAFVELRRIMGSHSDHFNTHILRSLTARLGRMRSEMDGPTEERRRASGGSARPTPRLSGAKPGAAAGSGRSAFASVRAEPDPQQGTTTLSSEETEHLSLQLEFFRNSVHMDLKRWEERWLSGVTITHDDAAAPTPLQVTGALHLDYAALVTYSLPLPIRYTVDVSSEMEHFYRHCYSAATGYMSVFADRCQRGFMLYVNNTSVVSAVYCAIFALDLCRRASRLPFIRPKSIEAQARKVASLLKEIASACPNRLATLQSRTVASKYSDFLTAVLDRRQSDQGHRVGDRYFDAPVTEAGASNASFSGPVRNSSREASSGAAQLPRARTGLTPLLRAEPGETFGPREDAGATGMSPLQSFETAVALPSPYPLQQLQEPLHRSDCGYSPSYSLGRSEVGSPRQPSGTAHFRSGRFPAAPAALAGGSNMSHNDASNSASRLQPARTSTSTSEADTHFFSLFQQQQQQHQQGQTQQLYNGNAGAPSTPGSGSNMTPAGTAAEATALDSHWAWMMSDLDFFQLDGGDPIMDQMGRLFG